MEKQNVNVSSDEEINLYDSNIFTCQCGKRFPIKKIEQHVMKYHGPF